MDHIPYAELKKGTLLIASPDISSPLYFRSVILLCEHFSGGSFGLILNKPLHLEMPEDIATISKMENPHIRLASGGPLQPHQMLLLHDSDKAEYEAVKICEGVYLGGNLNFLQEAVSQETGPKIKLLFGYTGWASGQLENEFLEGLWYLHPSRKELIFDIPEEKMWSSILMEMGSKYASIATMPEDLSVN